jgi:hypothetical protein
MNSLKTKCLEYIRRNCKNLLREALDKELEIPLDQIEENLFDDLSKYLMSDYNGVVRLI